MIFLLSLPALVMAFATVYLIPSRVEPAFWLAIFVFCAWRVARNIKGKLMQFYHGFAIAIFNSFWITVVHLSFVNDYLKLNPGMQEMYDNPAIANHPRLTMAIFGICIGIISGLVLGFFCLVAGRMQKKQN
ncbi:MAG: hypothetical protein KG003_06300 [Bacteroidetes bacterium]|nr:hypothetical protein [Bacteroidota bacterium]